MKAIVLKSFGGPESFELRDVPKPRAGQVLVRVHATSINPLDYQVRRGDYPDLVPLPAITGHDVSGVIEAVGAGVTAYAPGDEVCTRRRSSRGRVATPSTTWPPRASSAGSPPR